MLENQLPRSPLSGDAVSLSRPEDLLKKTRTAPLTLADQMELPSGLNHLDQLKPPRIPTQPLIPAQNSAITQALETPLSDQDAEALIVGSKNLSELHQSAPALFKETMQALSAQGRQATLTPRQQQLIEELDLPTLSPQVSNQLYQMMLPIYQGQSSNAFKVAQQAVTGFMSKMKVEERTLKKIEQDAKDLVRSSEVISGLTAGSVSSLLEDKTAEAYDMAVSQIDSRNFDIKTGMDYTLSQFIVQSQSNPQLLQQAESALNRLQQKQFLASADRTVLSQLGLRVNEQGQVTDHQGQSVNTESLARLQDVAFSMMDPTPAYQSILKASADVINQSGKLLILSKQAEAQSQVVQKETQVLNTRNQEVNQIRQETAAVNQQLVETMGETEQLQKLLAQNMGIAAPGNIATVAPTSQPLLAKLNIQIVQQAGGPVKFQVNGQEVSQLNFIQHLSQQLSHKKAEVQALSSELQEKRSDLIKSAAELATATQNVSTQAEQLNEIKTNLEVETARLQDLELVYHSTVQKVSGKLKPSESKAFTVMLQPFVQQTTAHAKTVAHQVCERIERIILPMAHQAVSHAQTTLKQVESDNQQYEKTLKQSQDLQSKIDTTLAELESKPETLPGQPTSPGRRQERAIQQQPFVLQYKEAEARSERDILASGQENRKMQQKVARQIEEQHMVRQADEERYQAQWEAKRENEARYQQDRQTFQDEQKRLLDDQ